jgi:hypothetical protein
MSNMKKLIESLDTIAGSNPAQKEGDQVRGTDKATPRGDGKHPFNDRLVGESDGDTDDFLGKPYRRDEEQVSTEVDADGNEIVGEDEINELSKGTLGSYAMKANAERSNPNMDDMKADRRGTGTMKALDKMAGYRAGPIKGNAVTARWSASKGLPSAERDRDSFNRSVKRVMGESVDLEAITEELRQAFEDFVGDPYSENNVTPKEAKKPGKDKAKAKLQKVKDPKMVEGKSENRELWDRIKSRGTVPGIDKERYTDLSHEGLEGPFRQKNGQVLYYDPKAGQYYNRDTDMYIDAKDHESMNEGDPDIPAHIHDAMKAKEREQFRAQLMRNQGERNRKATDDAVTRFMAKPERNVGVVESRADKIQKLRAKFESLQSALGEAKKELAGKKLQEAPIDQTVAQPGQQPAAPGPQPAKPQGGTPAPAQAPGTPAQAATPATGATAPASGAQAPIMAPAKIPSTPQEKAAAATGAAASMVAQPGGAQKVAAGLKLDPTTMQPQQ